MESGGNARRHTVVLGITGSVAAYKAAELARQFVQRDIEVHVAMTASAKRLVGAATMRALSGHPVMDDEWDSPNAGDGMDHIAGARAADLIVVAPASANFIAKVAHGFADDLLSAMLLARDCPALVAPAMNRAMWENPATQANVARLAEMGVEIVGPSQGEQACGEFGPGRLADTADIVSRTEAILMGGDLGGVSVMVSAGATCERLDPMRTITNASSGKMGVAVAEAARLMGAQVTLVAGRVSCPLPAGMRVVRVETGAQMEAALAALAPAADIFVSVAAVGDYRPRAARRTKHQSAGKWVVELERTNDLLAQVAGLPNAPFCVGFAAETGDVVAKAKRKMRRKNIPLIVANDVEATVGSDWCELAVISAAGKVHALDLMKKREAAAKIMGMIAEAYREAKGMALGRGTSRIGEGKAKSDRGVVHVR